MSKPRFYAFENNNTSSIDGVNNAAVISFNSDQNNSIAKELTQNSLDARVDRDGIIKIKISNKSIPKFSIPNFDQFEKMLKTIEDYHPDDAKFFNWAKKSIEGDEIKVFVFEDFMTKGLEGDDKGKNLPPNSTVPTFQYLVNAANKSGKDHDDSLGGHGIGKNSVFGASAIRTVFYSSLDRFNNYKFKGVSKLATFYDDNDVYREKNIWYGNIVRDNQDKPDVELVSELAHIPSEFRRTEPGLSQYVLGSLIDGDWEKDFSRAFIKNYWFLFEHNKLSIEIGNKTIDNSNYLGIAEKLYSDDRKTKDNPISFIKTFKESDFFQTRKISKIGEVHFYLREAKDDEKYPNKIVFLRDGMLITDIRKSLTLPNSIAGVMYCSNRKGNIILGAMEPHEHNKFNPNLLKEKGPSDIHPKDGKKILKEINDFARDVLTEFKEKYTRQLETVDFIDELFSEITALDSKEKSSGSKSLTKDETFNRKYLPKVNFNVMFNSHERNSKIIQNSETDLGDGEGPGVGTGKGGRYRRQGEGVRGIPSKEGKGGGSSESKTKTKGKFKHQINSRFFIVNEGNNNKYNLVIKSNNTIPDLGIVVSQKGDSDRVKIMSSRLIEVESSGQALTFLENKNSEGEIISYQINGLNIKEGEPYLVELTLDEKNKSALKIIETK